MSDPHVDHEAAAHLEDLGAQVAGIVLHEALGRRVGVFGVDLVDELLVQHEHLLVGKVKAADVAALGLLARRQDPRRLDARLVRGRRRWWRRLLGLGAVVRAVEVAQRGVGDLGVSHELRQPVQGGR